MLKVSNYLDYSELRNEVWGDAEWTLEQVEDSNKEEELMQYLEDVFGYDEAPTMTEVNDFLWFEWETIFEDLGVKNPFDDDEEDEDEDEDWDEDEEDDEDDDGEIEKVYVPLSEMV